MKQVLGELIQTAPFQAMLEKLFLTFGCPITILDGGGRILASSQGDIGTSLLHRIHFEGNHGYSAGDHHVFERRNCGMKSVVSIFRLNGLVDVSCPVYIGNAHHGSVTSGRFFYEKPNLDFFRDQARQCNVNEDDYLDAVKRVPIISHDRLDAVVFFVESLVDMLESEGECRECENRPMMDMASTHMNILENETMFKKIFEEVPIGIAQLDEVGLCLNANRAFLDILGIRSEASQRPFNFFLDPNLPKDVLDEINGRQSASMELEYDFGKIRECQLYQTSREDRISVGMTINRYTEEHTNGSTRYLVMLTNNTEKRKEESYRILLQTQMFHAEKLASIGIIASSVAHEINNPLQIIEGHVELIANQLGRISGHDEEKQKITGSIRKQTSAIRRISKITDEIMRYSRNGRTEDEVVDLHAVIRDTLATCAPLISKSRIQIDSVLTASHPLVFGNADKFHQLFTNLIVNARDALEEMKTPCIHIETYNSNEALVVEFSDNGPGIPSGLVEKIFDPFFTSKPAGKGTGLGLYISKTIVNEAKGEIIAAGEFGKGAVFKIRLPESSI